MPLRQRRWISSKTIPFDSRDKSEEEEHRRQTLKVSANHDNERYFVASLSLAHVNLGAKTLGLRVFSRHHTTGTPQDIFVA